MAVLTLRLPLRKLLEVLALGLKVNVIPHQTQQTTDFVDGSNAAEEAHGH